MKDWAPKIQIRAQNHKKLLNSGPKIAFRVPKSDKFKGFGPENSISGSESVPKLATILEETQEDLHTEAGESSV